MYLVVEMCSCFSSSFYLNATFYSLLYKQDITGFAVQEMVIFFHFEKKVIVTNSTGMLQSKWKC